MILEDKELNTGTPSLPGVATADVVIPSQREQQAQLNIEPDYHATEGSQIPEEQAQQLDTNAELKNLSDEELILLAQASFQGEEIPQSVAMKVPNLMKRFAQEAAEATPKNTLISALGATASAAKDIAVGAAVGAASGVLSTATAVTDGLNWLDDAAGWDVIPNEGLERVREHTDSAQKIMESWIPESFLGQMSGSVGRFGVGLSAASGASGLAQKVTKGKSILEGLKSVLGASTLQIGGTLAKGATASVLAFSPDDPRFADLIQQFPSLQNPLTEYLAAQGNENDSMAEKRFKQAMDSILGDVVTEGVLKGIAKSLKIFKKSGGSPKGATSAIKVLDDTDAGLAKELQSVENGATTSKATGGAAVDGQLSGTSEASGQRIGRKRPGRGKGKIQYEDARAGTGQGVAQTDGLADPGGAPGVDGASGHRVAPPDDVHPPASAVPDGGAQSTVTPHHVEFDEDAALAKAQRLYAKGVADGGTPYEFRPTNDITNAKYYNDVILEDGGVARLLELGNDTDANVLNRPASEFTIKPLEETANEARDILNAYADKRGLFNELSKTAEFAEGLAHKVVMAKDATAQSAYVLGGILHKLDDATLDAAARQAIIDGEARTALKNYATLASFFDRISTGTGRALNAHKIKGELSPAVERIITTVDNLSPDEAVGLMRRIVVADNPLKGAKMLRVVSHTKGQKFVGMLTEYWINSILSGITTNTVNFTSNLLKAGVLQPLDNMMLGWGGLSGGLFHINNREVWNQGVYAWWGMAEALRESWDMAVKSFKLGSNILKADNSFIEQQARKLSSSYAGIAADTTLGKSLDTFGKAVNLPTRFLMAADEFASQMAYRGNVRVHLLTKADELFAKGAGQGMTRKEFLNKYIKDNFDSFFTDAVTGSGQVVKGGTGTFKQGLDAAMEVTFTKPLVQGSLGETLQHAVAKHPLLQHITPFIRTPMNILNDSLMRIPGLNFLSAEFRAAYREGGEAWARAQAKLAVGTMFCGVATSLYLGGRITGSPPKDKATRDALMATGWRPHSIKVGDKYISYGRLEPISTVLSAIADAGAIMTSAYSEADPDSSVLDNAGTAALAVTLGIAKNLTSKSYMAGLSEFLEVATSDDGNKVSRWFAKRTASYIPNIASSARKMTDPTMNEVRTLLDACMDKVPGLSSSLAPRYSWITGQPIQYMGGMASGFSPVVWESEKDDPVLEGMAQVASALTAPTDRVNGIKLSGHQVSDYFRLHGSIRIDGKTMLEALREAHGSKAAVTPDREDEDISQPSAIRFNKIIRRYRNKAKQELLKLYPELKKKNQNAFGSVDDIASERRYKGVSPDAVMSKTRARGLEALADFK